MQFCWNFWQQLEIALKYLFPRITSWVHQEKANATLLISINFSQQTVRGNIAICPKAFLGRRFLWGRDILGYGRGLERKHREAAPAPLVSGNTEFSLQHLAGGSPEPFSAKWNCTCFPLQITTRAKPPCCQTLKPVLFFSSSVQHQMVYVTGAIPVDNQFCSSLFLESSVFLGEIFPPMSRNLKCPSRDCPEVLQLCLPAAISLF